MDNEWQSDEQPEHIFLSPVNFDKQVDKLIAVKVEKTDMHTALSRAYTAKPGNYHLVAIDSSGHEIPGSDFEIGERGYKSFYSNNPKFIVKKKYQ